MEENKKVVHDTMDFILFDEDGKKILELKETRCVNIYNEKGNTFVGVTNALLDTKMFGVLGVEEVQEMSDFDKASGNSKEFNTFKMKSYTGHDIDSLEKVFKAVVYTKIYNPDTLKVEGQLKISFPSIKVESNGLGEFSVGQAFTPKYLFKSLEDYIVTVVNN